MTLIELLVLFTLAWTFMFTRASSGIWVMILGIVLFTFSHYGTLPTGWSVTLWIIFAVIAMFAILTPLRKMLFSKPFLSRFRKILPPMSITEREALEAGDVWWEGDLFCGRPEWDKLHTILRPGLTREEQAFMEHEVEELCALLEDWKIVYEDCDLSPAAWAYLKDKGFFGLVIDKKYGGKGFSAYAHSTVVTKIASRSLSGAVNAMVPNSLGPGELLQHYGTEEQKNYYLPRLAKGQEIPCFALTSTDAGSDAGAMNDFGVVCMGQHNGAEVLGIRLTWSKRYITLAPAATVLGLAFKLYDPDHLVGKKEEIGITLALLPASHPGVKIGLRHYPLGVAFLNGPTEGKDVFVPMDFIIGGSKMMGKGWRMLMECLSIGRSISLPALGAGVSNLSYLSTGMYAYLRKQFKISVGQFEGVQEPMAKIAGYTYLLEASRRMTAGAVDLHVKPSVVSAIQKYHSTELARLVCDAAMDIHAGRAIQFGPRNYLGLSYVAIPVAITVEGANILTRNLIIFGQGAVRCHPYVVKEMEAAADKDLDNGLRLFDGYLKAHIGYAVSNFVRAVSFGITNAHFVKTPHHKGVESYYRQLTRMSTALALTSDIAMLMLGGNLKRKERLSARLGDVLSHLYLATTLLKYHADEGYPEMDLPYLQWGLQTCLHEIQTAFNDFFENFPVRAVSKILKRVIFPFGSSYRAPSDKLDQTLVNMMMAHVSPLRDRLCKNVYVGKSANDPLGRLVNAFNKVVAAEPLEAKVTQAIRDKIIHRARDPKEVLQSAMSAAIITHTEMDQIVEARTACQDAMEVDSFEPEYLLTRMSKHGVK